MDNSTFLLNWTLSQLNVVPDIPNGLQPPLDPETKEPMGPDKLAAVFPMGLLEQEMSDKQFVDIPEEVQEILKIWRPAPLVRATNRKRFFRFIKGEHTDACLPEIAGTLDATSRFARNTSSLRPERGRIGPRMSTSHIPEYTTATASLTSMTDHPRSRSMAPASSEWNTRRCFEILVSRSI